MGDALCVEALDVGAGLSLAGDMRLSASLGLAGDMRLSTGLGLFPRGLPPRFRH